MNSEGPRRNSSSAAVIRMDNEERLKVLETIKSVSSEAKPRAVCVYGSHVAGYAKADSDYDVLIVLPNFQPKVRYKYISNQAEVSALLVDSEALEKDAAKASLGEFVVGRLLNVYEPLEGEAFLEQVEFLFKRRVFIETLQEVAGSVGEFASELLLPISYFLFEKIRKRAAIYPPALYSYSKTYSKQLISHNLPPALNAFEGIARQFAQEGIVTYDNGYVGIPQKSASHIQVSKVSAALTQTARGVRQYAVHGYAGRVGLGVVRKEVASKLSRSKEIESVPDEIRLPKSLWKVEEGRLIAESDDWLRPTAEALGFDKNVKVTEHGPDELYYTSTTYTLEQADKKVSVAVKRFRDIWAVKWAFLKLWALPGKTFDLTPLSRLRREYHASRELRKIGLNTPEIVCVMLADRILITKFIDGVDLGRVVSSIHSGRSHNTTPLTAYGEAISIAHSHGYTIGDTKPSNAVIQNDRLFLVDLEQAGEGGDRSWDIAEFIYYSNKLTLNASAAKVITDSFLEGYMRIGDRKAVQNALNLKYLAPFEPLILPTVAKAVRDTIKSRLRE